MKIIISSLFFCLLPLLAWAELPRLIKVCDDQAEWPPYTYSERSEGKKTQKIVGYSIDFLTEIFSAKNIKFTIDLVPWAQCLEDLRQGKYDMTLNAGFNSERNRNYLISRTFYSMTPVYFFDNSKKVPLLESAADLKKYKLCGVKGYNYRAGFLLDADSIDLSSTSIIEALKKMKEGKCEIVPERLEAVVGYKVVKTYDYEANGISYRLIPQMEPVSFHMMMSRKIPYRKELYQMINEGINHLRQTEKDKALLKKYSILSFQH